MDRKNRNDVRYHPDEGGIYDFDPKNLDLGQFQVLKVEDNLSNGMQARVIAPVINEKVDTAQIIIAYAGTNASDGNDLETDIKSVVLGSKLSHETAIFGYYVIRVPVDSQIDTAIAFSEKVKSQYPQAKIETTGHSQRKDC